MDDKVLHLDEIRLRHSIEETERVLEKAHTLIADGYSLPQGTINRLEYILETLEKKLINLIEKDDPSPSS